MGKGDTKAIEIDVAKLESSLKDWISPEHAFRAYKSCIYKTPKILKRHNPEAYTPAAVSIGPMHHENPNLADAEKIKSLYLRDFLLRSTAESPFTLTTVIEVVKKLVEEARACYAESVDVSPEELVKILAVDGCFLIEYRSKLGSDPIQTQAAMLQFLYHDLVLLENQIPWIVLDGLFNQTVKQGPEKSTLKKLVTCFLYHFSATNTLQEPSDQNYDCKHILDLIHQSLISPLKQKEERKWKRVPSVVQLSQAGVKLVTTENPSSILDVRFDRAKGQLEIPHIRIMEATEAIYRNLISYEQCYPGCKPIVTSYLKLMDNLVDRSEDLEKLCEEGIVENRLDQQEVPKQFNNMDNGSYVTEFYYSDLSFEVDDYCKQMWPRFRTWYLQNFTSPLAIVTQVAGVFGLSLTLLQTVFSFPGLGSKK